MSFVNDVMSEEADRKGLILFEDYSLMHDVDLSVDQDIESLRKKYWINFSLVILALLSLVKFVDQLPISQRAIQVSTSNELELIQSSASRSGLVTQHNEKSTSESTTLLTIDDEQTDPAVIVVEKKIEVQQSVSRADDKLKKTEVQFTKSREVPVLDFTKKKAIFNKKINSDEKAIVETKGYQDAEKLLKTGEIDRGIDVLEKLIVTNQNHVQARLLLASTLINRNQKEQALNIYQTGLGISPKEYQFAQPLAHLLADKGQVNEALNTLKSAAPDYRKHPDYFSFIAALYQQSGQHENAISVYQRILNIQSDNGKWWLGLGISLMAKAKDKQALAAFEWSLRDERVPIALKQFASQRINDLRIRKRL